LLSAESSVVIPRPRISVLPACWMCYVDHSDCALISRFVFILPSPECPMCPWPRYTSNHPLVMGHATDQRREQGRLPDTLGVTHSGYGKAFVIESILNVRHRQSVLPRLRASELEVLLHPSERVVHYA
jgi:hypothetical protein